MWYTNHVTELDSNGKRLTRMADIKDYIKEKEKREKTKSDYRSKIRKHKMTTVYRVLLVAVVLIAVVVILLIQQNRRIFSDYETVSAVTRERFTDAIDTRLADTLLTYSKDGAHCTNAKGDAVWNQTYEIQDTKLAMCNGTVAIAEYNGRSIYIQNTAKQLGEITTTMPIREIAVAETGRVTAVLEDKDATWINTFDASGEMCYTGLVHMQESGYPISLSLSPNGELLAVSYVYVDAGIVKTNIAFYNFGPVGANQSDYMVGVHTYTDQLIPQVHFMNNDTAFAVGDGMLAIFKGGQKPTLQSQYILNNKEIRSVYYSEKYIGLVMTSDNNEAKYKMDVYGLDGECKGSYYFDIDYRHIFFEKDGFVVYNETECQVILLDQTVKYSGLFDKSVNLMIPTSKKFRYLIVTDHSIDTIQLK